MRTLMPAFGIGRTGRPATTGGIGFAPVGSVLTPVDSIISIEPLAPVIGSTPKDVTSTNPDDLISELNALLIESLEPEDITSATPIDPVTSVAPPDIVSEEPDSLESEEPHE